MTTFSGATSATEAPGQRTSVRVISLRDAAERRAVFTASAVDAGLAWSFFDALQGPQLPLVHAPEQALVCTGRALRPGELGCYASHFALWADFLASDASQLLVFEDDVTVDWVAIRKVASLDLAAMGVHMLKLFCSYPARGRTVRNKLYSDHSHLMLLCGYSYGTQAYVLTRQAAQRLVTHCAVLDMPVDWAMSRYWRHHTPVHAVVPSPVFERLVPSSIGHPPPAGKVVSSGLLARRWQWRIAERLRRLVADACLALKTKFASRDGDHRSR